MFLLNKDGEVIHQTGGEGRGPEEFKSILNPHIGDDGRLYVIDPLLFQISIYEIDDDRLEFVESVSYKNPENYFLTSTYVTDYGHFGLFQKSPNGLFSPENRFYFYRLNEDFTIIERLLELPGHERLKHVTPHFTFYSPHPYAKRTDWGSDQEWFYYFTTGDETIHRYNVQTGNKETLSFFELEERIKSGAFMEAVKEHHPDASDEEFIEQLNEIQSLPLFSSFFVENQKAFLNVLSAPGEDQMMLYIDLESGDVKHFETTSGFTPHSLCGNHLYGFNFGIDGETRLMSMILR